jgi:hypothetical protein
MSMTTIILGSVLMVMVYLLVRYRFLVLSEPIRKDLARRGERLIANPALPPKHRKEVEFWLDTTFETWWVPISVVLMPMLVILLPFQKDFWKDEAEEIEDDDVRREYRLVHGMSVSSDLMLSPLSSAILLPQLLVLTILFVPIPRLAAAIEKLHSNLFGRGVSLRNQGAH